MRNYGKARRLVFAVAVMLVFTMVGSTWAYWTDTIDTRNEYRFAQYEGGGIVESFVAPTGWLPGQDVNKDVYVKNQGTIPLFARVTLNQRWNYRDAAQGQAPIPLTFDAGGEKEYAAQIRFGHDVTVLASKRNPDASLWLPINAVNTVSEAAGKWLLVDETPDANGNLTFYYVGAVSENGGVTPKLLDSVELNDKLQAAVSGESKTYDKASGEWVTVWETNLKNAEFTLYKSDANGGKSAAADASGRPVTLISGPDGKVTARGLDSDTAYFLQAPAGGNQSYENAHYALDVRLTTVQGTEAALDATFIASGTAEQQVIDSLGNYSQTGDALNTSKDDSVSAFELYFEETNGKLVYTPVANPDGNWFMSDLNMLPGETYTHTLNVESRARNSSAKSYNLSMQAIPLAQDAKTNQLLEYISMKVYNGNELIYDGKASGQSYARSVNDLRQAVRLGTYAAGQRRALRAEVTLDPNTPVEYAGLTTRIDWRFMAEEVTAPTPTPSTPAPTYTPAPTARTTPAPTARTTPAPARSAAPTPAAPIPYGFVNAPDEPVPYGAPIAPASPKTGDESNSARYVLVMAIAGVCLLGCVAFLIATRKKREPQPAYGYPMQNGGYGYMPNNERANPNAFGKRPNNGGPNGPWGG